MLTTFTECSDLLSLACSLFTSFEFFPLFLPVSLIVSRGLRWRHQAHGAHLDLIPGALWDLSTGTSSRSAQLSCCLSATSAGERLSGRVPPGA